MIDVIACDSAVEFLQVLRRIHPLWLGPGEWRSNWIFRGQLATDGPLVPSAWRAQEREAEPYRLTAVDEPVLRQARDDHSELAAVDEARALAFIQQKLFERRVICAFASHVDQLGLPIPGDRFPPLHSPVPVWDTRTKDADLFLEVTALAQHHGMPTRLLDWTLNPTVAAFFAVERVADDADREESVVVWAVHRDALHTTPEEQRAADDTVPDRCREIRVRRSQVGFLHAQEGTFTYLPEADRHFLDRGEWPLLEHTLEPGAFRKVTLPAAEALEARRLLWADKVSRAHLMPNHDNVTKSLKQAWRQYGHEPGSPLPPDADALSG